MTDLKINVEGNLIDADTKQEFTLTVYTENQVGLMNRLSTIFSRRKLNIESMNSSQSEIVGIHRFNIVLIETEEVVRKLCTQIEKQVDILKAYYNNNEEIIWQEMALYKVPTNIITKEIKVERLLRAYGARAVVIREDYTIFEATGHREETDKLIEVLEPFGLIEFVRSARIAIIKKSEGFHKKLKEFETALPSELRTDNNFLNKQDEVFSM